MMLTTCYLIDKPFYRKYRTLIFFINGFAAGAGLLLMIAKSSAPGNHLYYGGLLLCCLFYYVFVPKQIISNILSWGMFSLYILVSIFFTDTPGIFFLYNIFIFFFFNIGGMFACYSMELSQRKEFIHKITIQDQADRLYLALSELEQQHENAQRLAQQDPLTGLLNRRHFFSVSTKTLEHSRKADQDTSLMLIEIDNFKEFQAHLGYVAGDQILALVGGIIGDIVRPYDTCCRYEGGEFAILLPDTPSNLSEQVGQKIMEYIKDADIAPGQEQGGVTVSVGYVTLMSGQNASIENLLDLANQALYAAKNCGKNQLRTVGLDGNKQTVPRASFTLGEQGNADDFLI
jgi:diguanylate cyclase (GGDEF)-like protein